MVFRSENFVQYFVPQTSGIFRSIWKLRSIYLSWDFVEDLLNNKLKYNLNNKLLYIKFV